MSRQVTCPTCQTLFESSRTTPGMCPKCLLRGAMPAAAPNNAAGPIHATQTYDNSIGGMPVPKPEEVNKLFPELEILDVIGQGGMGVVYKAIQKNLGREVALKLLSSGLIDDPAFAERFTREARAMARMNHPNIIAIYDFGQREKHHYLVMEFVDGLNLRQLVHSTKLEPNEAMQMVPQLCDALQYAHDRGIVHRDIKPENVLVSQEGLIKIADFGLAKLNDGTPGHVTLTQSRQVMGTLNYMAPEQVERPTDVDHRADIYSLGVVIYELLTGELPLGRFSAPSQRAEVDARLDEVVMRALEKDPGERYQQASEFKTGLQNVSHAGPFVRQFGGSATEQKLASKVAMFVWTSVALTLCIAGGIAIIVASFSRQEDQIRFVGFVVAGLGALLFALLGAFNSFFRPSLPEPQKPVRPVHIGRQRARALLQIMAVPVLMFSLVSYQLNFPSIVPAICLIVGVSLLVIRSNIDASSPLPETAEPRHAPLAAAKPAIPAKPMPNWLIGFKILALMCFFACPLFFIGSAFVDNNDGENLLRFMGIAAPITGGFLSAIVGIIVKNKGYVDPDGKDGK